MPLTADQLARRRLGQCEEPGCPRPASWIATRSSGPPKPLQSNEQPPESKRVCSPHSQLDKRKWHVARIKENA